MSTASEEILARYRQTERESDAFDRVIAVKRLNPAQQLRIMEMSASADETVRAGLFVSACVVDIDGDPITFPRSRAELDAIIARLDQEGMAAAGAALARLLGGAAPAETDDRAKK